MTQPQRVLADLGKSIRQARHAKGISQEELSLRTGVHRNYVGGIERGERSPTVITISKLADGLGVSLSDLFKSQRT